MPSIVKTLRVAADPNRLRILLLLKDEELSVAELQEILSMGQSTISTHLSQLKQAGLVEDRRTGKNNLYRLAAQSLQALALPKTALPKIEPGILKGHDFSRAENASSKKNGALAPEGSAFLHDLLARAALEIPEFASDQAALRRVLHKRQDKTRAFFDSVAGRLGKNYVPGKSWKSLAEALLRLLPPLTIADLGSGEGGFSLLLSQSAQRVIAVDSSARMIEVGRAEALRAGIQNIDFRLGDMEDLPLGPAEVDLVFFSQSLHHALHPERALQEAARILRPGGRAVILDLAKHRFEEARDLYADEWLGFSKSELESMLAASGFTAVETTLVDKEPDPPHFQTLLALATKPA
jgi:ubiquinone/menaquinone biosynthesis C-methylase UbiE/DNA-binding transcriptional ArsR family regulator